MSNTKITELTAVTALAGTDVFPVVDVSASTTNKVSVSDLLRNAPDGTAGAPSIANADDQDTGILFPAANSVGVSTGGTQRLVIDSSGNVGIAETSPSTHSAGTGLPTLVLKGNSGSHTDRSGAIAFVSQDDGSTAKTWMYHDTDFNIQSATATNIKFHTNNTERMKLTSSGRVAINTTSPSALLHVASAAGDGIFIGSNNAGSITRESEGLRITGSSTNKNISFVTAGSEAMRVDTSGRLLIGTSSALETAAGRQLQVSDANGAFLVLGRDDTTVGDGPNLGGVHFYGNDTTNNDFTKLGSIDCSSDGVHSSGDNPTKFTFSTTADGASSPTERLRIDSSGNTGIGTTPTTDKLEIAGNIRFSGVSNYIKFANDFVSIKRLSNSLHFNGYNGFRFYDTLNSTERARIDSSGNVGIGTTSPSRLLELKSSAPIIRLTESTNTYSEISANSSVLSLKADEGNGASSTRIDFRVDGSEAMRIDSSGHVGIGNTSMNSYNGASNDLVIGNHTGAHGLTIASQSNSNGYIMFADGTTGQQQYEGQIQYNHDQNFMRALTAGSERLRIDSSGNVGIGDSSPSYRLDVKQTSAGTVAALTGSTDGGRPLKFTSADNGIFLGAQWTRDVASSGGIHAWAVDGTERMRIKSNGQVDISSSIAAGENIAKFTNSSSTGNGLFTSVNSSSTSYVFFQGYSASASASRILIYTNGNVVNTNNSYGAISDIKLKENVVDASSQWNDIKTVQVRNFNFKEETGNPTHTQIGVVAQEVETVSPGLVSESPDRDEEGNDLGTTTKSVNYSVLYMKAVKALQEAMDRIETLETKVAALEAQ